MNNNIRQDCPEYKEEDADYYWSELYGVQKHDLYSLEEMEFWWDRQLEDFIDD